MITVGQLDAEQELASVCGMLNASYARLVAIVAAALEDESWAIAGVRSPEHWLSMRAGLSPFHARQVVAVSRRHSELPTVMGQFADGQLSLDQVAVVARYTPAHVEESVAEFAVNASVPQLRRALSRYAFDPPAAPGHQQGTTTTPQPNTTQPATPKPNIPPPGNTAPGNTEPGDTEPGNAQAGDARASDAQAADAQAADAAPVSKPAAWNGLAPIADRASAPTELSIGHDQWGRLTLRFTPPPTSAPSSKPPSRKPKTPCSVPDAPRSPGAMPWSRSRSPNAPWAR